MTKVKKPDFWCEHCERKIYDVVEDRERDPCGTYVVVNFRCPECDNEVEEVDDEREGLDIS